MNVEVAYALPNKQRIVVVDVEENCTAAEAVALSNIASQFEGLDISATKLGIFGKTISNPETHILKSGDRVEIYRPLVADPKEVRKARAAKAKKKT